MRFGGFVRDSVESMRRLGTEVRVVTVTDSRRGVARAALKYSGLLARTAVASARGGYDVVHAHFLFPTGVAGRLAAAVRGAPLIVFAHGSDVAFASTRGLVGILTRWVLRSAEAVVAPSRHLAAELEGYRDGRGRGVDVVPMGVDIRLFSPGDRAEARAAAGLVAGEPVVLFAGALDANKGAGCEDLLNAVDVPGLSGVRVVVVGTGPRRERLQARAAAGSLVGRVEFRGPVDRREVAVLMRAADAVTVPSRRESLGLVALEARAAGTPVVAAAVGGLPEHVVPGLSGELYPSGDVDALRAALSRVLSDPSAYRPPPLDERYTLEGSGRDVLRLSDAVLERGRRRA
ncbi:MAG TPA: glycosyltransferase [Desulfobacterales bacterium]|nr:glycosyltransferase [Desulfobacterales bacterium]